MWYVFALRPANAEPLFAAVETYATDTPVKLSTIRQMAMTESMAIFTSNDSIFFPRYSGVRPTASFSGYGKTIKLHSGDALVVHRSQDSRVVILEYEVHGKIPSGGAPYDNRFISGITIENRKIVHWRDYIDSLAAWRALNSSS